eukprot:5813523-Alexandrium_andersonii.AAC.1
MPGAPTPPARRVLPARHPARHVALTGVALFWRSRMLPPQTLLHPAGEARRPARHPASLVAETS